MITQIVFFKKPPHSLHFDTRWSVDCNEMNICSFVYIPYGFKLCGLTTQSVYYLEDMRKNKFGMIQKNTDANAKSFRILHWKITIECF